MRRGRIVVNIIERGYVKKLGPLLVTKLPRDLLELDGGDLRREPIEERKRLLAKLLKGQHVSIVVNEHYEEDGEIVFCEARRLGCEGFVSKRLGSIYRRGRSPLWVKVKNPNAPAVRREAEEDWGH